MTPREELKMAWTLWHLLSQVTAILWQQYEDEFMKLCIELDRTDIHQFGHDHDDGNHA